MPAAARVLIPLVLGVGRVVGMSGAQQILRLGVVDAAGILVADHQGQRGAGGFSPVHTGQKFHLVGLGAGGRKSVASGAAAIHGGGHSSLVNGQAGSQAVQHSAHGGTVAFAKNGHRYGISKGVFHRRHSIPSRVGSSVMGRVSARQQPSPGHLMTVMVPLPAFLSCSMYCRTFSLLTPVRTGRPSVR